MNKHLLAVIACALLVAAGCAAEPDAPVADPSSTPAEQRPEIKVEEGQVRPELRQAPKDCDECSGSRRTCCGGGRCWEESC